MATTELAMAAADSLVELQSGTPRSLIQERSRLLALCLVPSTSSSSRAKSNVLASNCNSTARSKI